MDSAITDAVAQILIRCVSNVKEVLAADEAAIRGYADSWTGTQAKTESAVGAMSKATIIAGALSAGFLAFSADAAVKYQEAMDQVRNQSLLSEDQIHSLSDSILKLGPEVGQTPEALAAGLLDVAKAGYSGAEAMGILSDASKQAAISHVDLIEAEKTIVSVLKAHVSGVHDVHDATVQLNAITQSSRVTYTELANSLRTGMLSALQATGLGLKDLGAAIGAMADGGQVGNRALMALRTVLMQMEEPPKKLAAALDSIGMSQNALANDMRSGGIVQAMTDLKSHMEAAGLSAHQQNQLIIQAFGQGAKAVLPMIDNLDALKKHYADQSGAAAKFAGDWEAAQKTVEFQIKDLRATFDALAVEIGTALLPALNAILQPMLLIGKGIYDMASAFPGLTTALLAGAVALGGLELALIGGRAAAAFYKTALDDLMRLLVGREMNIAKVREAVTGLGDAEAASAVKTDLLSAAEGRQVIANEALAGSSLATAGEVGGLGTVVQRASGLLVPMGAAAGEAAVGTEAAGAAAAGATPAVAGLGGAVGLLLQPEIGIPALAAVLGIVAYEKSPALRAELGQLGSALENKVVGIFNITRDAIGFVIGKIGDLIGAFGSFMDKIPGWIGLLHGLTAAFGALGNAIHGVGNFLGAVGNVITAPFKALGQTIDDHATSQQHLNTQLSEGGKALGSLTLAERAHTAEMARAHAGWVQIDRDASKYFSTIQSGATQAGDALAEAIAKGAPQSQINSLLGEAVQKTEAYTRATEAQAKAQQMINARLGDTVTGYNRVRDAATALTSETKSASSAMEQQADSAFTTMADRAIANAKRMSAGVVAEIDRIKAQLASPLPEMKLPGLSTYTLNSPIPGTSEPALPHGGAQQAMELSGAAQSAFSQLTTAINGLPPAYRSMMSSVESDFTSKLGGLYNNFIDKLNAENQRYSAALQKLHDDFNAKVKASYEQAQQKLDALYQGYLVHLQNLNSTHETRLQSILQTFETSFQTMLFNYQAREATLQQQFAQINQNFAERLQTLHDTFTAKLESIHGKNADEQRKNLETWYQNQIKGADYSYGRQIEAATRTGEQITSSFNRGVSALDARLQNQIDSQQRAYDQAVKTLDAALKAHETGIAEHLKRHVDDLRHTLDRSIKAQQELHSRHEANLYTIFEQGAKKLADALKSKDLSPHTILSTLQSQSEKGYNDALEKATVDILLHGKATESDIEALKKAASLRDRIAKAEQEAQQESGTTAKATTKSVLDFKSALDAATKAVQADTDRIAQILFRGTGGEALAKTPQQQAENRMAEKAGLDPVFTQMSQAISQLIKDYERQHQLQQIEEQAQMRAAKATGDWATVLKLTEDHIKSGLDTALAKVTLDILNHGDVTQADSDALTKAANNQERLNLASQKANDLLIDKEIKAALAAGDLATAAKLTAQQISDKLTKATDTLTEAFYLNGQATQSQIDQARAAEAEQERWNTAMMQADEALGQFSKALSSLQQQIDGNVNNAFDNIVLKIFNHQQVTQADIDSLVAAKQKQDQLNAAMEQAYITVGDFSSAFDTANKAANDKLNAAESQYAYDWINHTGNLQKDAEAIKEATISVNGFKAAMDHAKEIEAENTPATLQQVQSAQDAIVQAQIGVIAANTTIISDESKAAVDGINALTTAVRDQTSIMQAEEGVVAASYDAQIKAVQDQSKIAVDTLALARATDPLSLQIAQAQLALDRDKAAHDRAVAAAALRVAQDELRLAQVKAAADAADAAAKSAVDAASLKVDFDKLKIAQDHLKLAMDQLQVLGDIDQALTGMTTAQQLLASDQAQINRDSLQQATDEQGLAMAQASEAQIAAMGQLAQAMAEQQVESDKMAQQQVDLSGQLQEARDQAHLDMLNAMKQNAQNTQSIVDTLNEIHDQQEELTRLSEMGLAGIQRVTVAPMTGTNAMMSQWASDAARNVAP